MADASVKKVEAGHSPSGTQGQKYLATGKSMSMRLWEQVQPLDDMKPVRRTYETVGYVIAGHAELTTEGQTVKLQPGSSWIVPKDAEHSYRVIDTFTAVEATHPPAEIHDRDAAPE